ncbi:MAG: 7-cyano-7-deazaguanine synthase QueC [Gammaproteobacteria bacterium]|nr:MAG: 7-cyano-7-deazaguanine synthase QueC [Gammaproteobacteria bacterium]
MTGSEQKKAVILLSGGLDSTTVLAIARDMGFQCYALSVQYGQRHEVELEAASRIARQFGVVEHKVCHINLDLIGGSALTDPEIAVPTELSEGIPVTYVPARNTLFLSLALGWAEVLGSTDIFIGVNAVDYSGYPDCRPEFIREFQRLAALATKCGVEGSTITIHTPLIDWSKDSIIRRGMELGVDYSQTLSCYNPDKNGLACGVCDACRLRRKGFEQAAVPDPTRYQDCS